MDLSIAVTFAALDRLTGPLKKIGQTSGKTAQAVARTTREIAALSREQAQLGKLKVARLDLDKNNAALDAQRRKVRELKLEMASAERPTKRLENALGAAERKERQLADTTQRQSTKLQGLTAAARKAGIDVGNLTAHENKLAGALQLANTRLDAQQRKLAAQQKFNDRMARAGAVGGKLQSIGAQAGVAGAAIGAPLVASANTWRDFQSGMTDIAQKAGKTRAQIAGIGDEIMRTGPAVAQLPSDLAKGLDTLVGLGMDLNQGAAALRPIGKTATAYKADVTDLSNTIYAATSNLKLFQGAERDAAEQQRRTAKALDIMAVAGKRGGFELKDMAKSFPSLTARAQALGQSGASAVADLSAALQIARRGAGDADEAATNIQNVLAKINMKDTIQNFDKMGVNLPAALKKAYKEGKTPLEAIAEITNKTLGGKLDKLPFLFGDMQAQAGITSLIQNLDDYRKIRADAAAAGDVVDADFAQRMQDSAAKTARFNAQMEVLKSRVGGTVGPELDRLKEKIAGLAERFIAWGDRNPAVFRSLVLIASGLAALLVTVGTAALVLGIMMPALAILWTGLTKLWGVMRIGLIIMRILGQALLWLGRLALANPWIALAVGIGVAAYLIWKHWDAIKAWTLGALAAIGGAISSAWNAIVGWAGAVWARIRAAFAGGVMGIAGVILNFHPLGLFYAAFAAVMRWFGVTLPSSFAGFGGMLIQGLINGIGGKLAALKNKIMAIAGAAKTWFKDALGIKSPSRVFAAYGGFITRGLALGVARGAGEPLGRVRELAGRMAADGRVTLQPPRVASRLLAGGLALAAPAAAAATTPVDRIGSNSVAIARAVAPIAPVGGRAGAISAGPPADDGSPREVHHHHNETFQITLPPYAGGDVRAMARELMAEIERLQRSRSNGSYDDD